MGKINKLPPHVINLIAAGEVVERPASVVKEILENSIDANATHIKVYIENYGLDLIEIIDDGIGIESDDIDLVFEQHATSKIKKSSDLLKINSFGFRGEAMASIRSVAEKIILQSKTPDSNPKAVVVTPTTISEASPEGYNNGTRIQVFNLFATVPARKKFLKSNQTELRHIIQVFIHASLANPEIHFELYHNNKQLYNLEKTSIENRIKDILGREFLENSYNLTAHSNSIKLNGFLGNSKLGKKTNPVQYIFINKRFVTNKTISSAIQKAYSGFLHKDLKPQYILFLTLDSNQVDVNVHPRKLEVRFDDPGSIFKSVFLSVKKTLEKESKQELLKDFLGEENNFSNEPDLKTTNPPRHYLPLQKTEQSNKIKFNIGSQRNKNYEVKKALEFTQQLLSDEGINSSKNEVEISFSWNKNPMQIFGTYILFEQNSNLIIVDQHAAHEKIIFEKLLRKIQKPKSKPLLIPAIVELTTSGKDNIKKIENDLIQIGFKFERFGQKSLQIMEIPEDLENINLNEFFDEIINEESDDLDSKFSSYEFETSVKLTQEQYVVWAKTACHGSIRAGQKLSIDEMNKLINDLFSLKYPKNCPHGRPTYYKLTKEDIDKFFKRII
ncbi:MAG: DNA mismatch repair protein MutL [Candidatus Dojkabacteria bacterium]|nr:MAG: DNA mismatch repair protein MutL [Candidatus Dojkabacteria bacterium]